VIRQNLKKELSPLLGLCIQVSIAYLVIVTNIQWKIKDLQMKSKPSVGTKNFYCQPKRTRLSRIRHRTASLHGTLAEHH
jgi:hypothetical protein